MSLLMEPFRPFTPSTMFGPSGLSEPFQPSFPSRQSFSSVNLLALLDLLDLDPENSPLHSPLSPSNIYELLFYIPNRFLELSNKTALANMVESTVMCHGVSVLPCV